MHVHCVQLVPLLFIKNASTEQNSIIAAAFIDISKSQRPLSVR